MLKTAHTYLTEQDSFAAIDYLNRQQNPLEVINVYADLIVQLYWQEKNLPAVIMMARAGIQYGLAVSAAAAPDAAVQIKSVAKGIAYNLAAFTWPGWNEPGIVIGSTDLAIGLDAAKLNLRLANELIKGDLPLSRACWMLGGHYLAAGHLTDAGSCFNEAEHYAAAAGEETERLLARGFALITTIMAQPDNNDALNQLGQVKHHLARFEHGEDLVKQLDTAQEIFPLSSK